MPNRPPPDCWVPCYKKGVNRLVRLRINIISGLWYLRLPIIILKIIQKKNHTPDVPRGYLPSTCNSVPPRPTSSSEREQTGHSKSRYAVQICILRIVRVLFCLSYVTWACKISKHSLNRREQLFPFFVADDRQILGARPCIIFLGFVRLVSNIWDFVWTNTESLGLYYAAPTIGHTRD